MNVRLLDILRCPKTGSVLTIDSGFLFSDDGSCRYPIIRGIPRFVAQSNYADSFGMQWNRFAGTQLDSHSGHGISAARFWKSTRWDAAEMNGKWTLDGGCGSGRFAEVALSSGAQVVAIDLSSAVDACRRNLGHHPNLHVVQASLYELPFQAGSFPFVYSLGVLQHTPDVRASFFALPPLLGEGGHLCVDYYEKTWKSLFLPKYLLRPVTRRLPHETLFPIVEKAVPFMLPISGALSRVPAVGRALKRVVPIVDYGDELPLTREQRREWAVLDTFDMFAPAHDHPQTAAQARRWMDEAEMTDVEVERVGHLVLRGRRL